MGFVRPPRTVRVFPLLIAICFVVLPAQAQYSGGTGEPDNPYQIATGDDWQTLMNTSSDWDRDFILTAAIDLNDVSVSPVGIAFHPFVGVFDGNGHVIRNVVIHEPDSSYVGLFGVLGTNGRIANTRLETADIVGRDYVGGLVGRSYQGNVSQCDSACTVKANSFVGGMIGLSSGNVTDCRSTGIVNGNGHVGGLIGEASGTVIRSSSTSTVRGYESVGGLIGNNADDVTDCDSAGTVNAISGGLYIGGLSGKNYGTISHCSSTGPVSGGSTYTGGLVGWNERGDVNDCFSVGVVSGSYHVGGLVGLNIGGSISKSFSTSNVSGQGYVGGLAGENQESLVTSCHSTGIVSGNYYVGGLIGMCQGSSIAGRDECIVAESYSTSTVINSWGTDVGGLVGSNHRGYITQCCSVGAVSGAGIQLGGLIGTNQYGTVNQCYSTCAVSGENRRIGGLVGYNWSGAVMHSYSIGAVTGEMENDIGGLLGYNRDGSVVSSFWDVETSGQPTSDGGTAKTTTEMQMESTFAEAGWDLEGETANGTEEVWKISAGLDYPRLWWEKYSGGTGDPNNPYRISRAEDFVLLGESPEDYGKSFILIHDVDLSELAFSKAVIACDNDQIEFGFQGTPFVGSFDGNNHVVSNLRIEGISYLGLFGQLNAGAQVSNLGLETVSICGSPRDLDFSVYSGSIAGRNLNGSIAQSYSTGSVAGGQLVGGLVGGNSGSGYIVNCNSTCIVAGETKYVGGLMGRNSGSTRDCFSVSTVSGTMNYVGGLVGFNEGTLSGSYSSSTVLGGILPTNFLGGLVGYNERGSISNCYSTGSASGYGGIGGLVGGNLTGGSISNCHSNCSASGVDGVGGLVGTNSNWDSACISNCYSTGTVTGERDIGGLVGDDQNWNLDSVSACFWDENTSGLSRSDGGLGLSTTQMKQINTYLNAGWDFVDEIENGTEDIWRILEGQDYPRLWWELASEN